MCQYAKEYILKSLSKDSIVYMSIKPGTNQVLSSSYSGGLPSQIHVNGNSHNGRTYIISSSYLSSSEINNISLIWNNSITNCAYMFNGLDNIISLDMSKFDFSNVNSMAYMFSNCGSLIYLNLNNINTSSVTAMHNLFYGCSSIEYLNLYSLNTSRVGCLCNMFNGCRSLLYINIIKLKDPSGCVYSDIFRSCKSQLKYTLNSNKAPNFAELLSSYTPCIYIRSDYYDEYNDKCFLFCLFGSSDYILDDNCFDKCYNYYNYSKIECFSTIPEGYFVNDTTNDKIIAKCNEKCHTCDYQSYRNNLCITCNTQSNFYPILNNTNYFICTDQTPEGFHFSDNSYKPCYYKCKTCYQDGSDSVHNCDSCFENYELIDGNCTCNYYYLYNNETNFYDCVYKCPVDFMYVTKDKICTDKFDMMQLITQQTIIESATKEQKDELLNNLKEGILSGEFDEIIYDTIGEKKQDLYINAPNMICQITSSENQNNNEYNDTSNIKLGNCEEILRAKYKMNDTDQIIILKIDVNEEGHKVPLINYELYNLRTKEKLNLSLCDDSSMKVYLPAVDIEENNLMIYNTSSEYYNDICYSHSENGVDITTKDRKSDFNNNRLSLCESNCEYKGYDIKTKKSECDCKFKLALSNISDIIDNKDKLISQFKDIKNTMNLKVFKCYKNLFTKNGLKCNICSYIFLGMILSNIICLLIFSIKDYKSFKKLIKRLLKHGDKMNFSQYFNKKDEIKNEDNSKNILDNQTTNLSKKELLKLKNNIKKDSKNSNIAHMMTLDLDEKKKKKKHKHRHKDKHKHKKDKKKHKKLMINDYEINIMSYKDAIKFDKRGYCDYYCSLLKRGQLILFSFVTKSDYNIRSVKISIFILFFALSYTVNTLFFTDDTMHNIVEVEGKFNILYQLPNILCSSLISFILNAIILNLALSEESLIELKNHKKDKSKIIKRFKKILIIKLILFFVVGFILLIVSWYYVSCFCLVYKNTQLYLLKDTLINFAISCATPFILCLFPGIFRIPSLKGKNPNKPLLYKFSKFIEFIIS